MISVAMFFIDDDHSTGSTTTIDWLCINNDHSDHDNDVYQGCKRQLST